MKKKMFLFLAVSFVFLGFSCQNQSFDTTTITTTESETSIIKTEEKLKETVYTEFIINTHDWTNPKESIETLNRIIDLHEEYQMPVDIYLDDQVTQIFQDQAPELIERLKNSSFVAVSYHLRPPYPYYWDYDWLGLDKMNQSELNDLLLNYEEHKIDLVTGQPTIEPGGYQLLKDLMGYPPYVATVMGGRKVAPLLAKIYKDKGAMFSMTHSGTTGWKEMENGLWMRPEDLEVKVYETKKRQSCDDILTESLADITTDRPAFLNLKWHEDNFYTSGTPWGAVYSSSVNAKDLLYPPYDLSQAMVGVKTKNETEQAEQWIRYEECLIYVKDHPEIFTAINARDLSEMME